jgi:UPF0271 protein
MRDEIQNPNSKLQIPRVDLSADLGEGAPREDEVWPLICSANVACGGHVGDETSMTFAVRRARELGVRLGAHPSFPDRENFGRKPMTMLPIELRSALAAQIRALREVAAREDVMLAHVKPHGALYNMAHHDLALAGVIIDAMRDVDPSIAIVCPDASQMAVAARVAGVAVIREAFADRRYNADGSLVSRSEADALLDVGEAAEQAQRLAKERAVIAKGGARVAIAFDTICVHADMEGAVERLVAIRKILD